MSQIRKIRYRLFAWRHFPELKPSQEPIDVVIPYLPFMLGRYPSLCSSSYQGYLYRGSTTGRGHSVLSGERTRVC